MCVFFAFVTKKLSQLVSASAAKQSTSSASFGRTTAERHMTFAERKKSLIETARKRYLEKHGLLDAHKQQSFQES
jgi:hypothetical protein